MEQNDLTRLKHVGPSRRKLLHAHGITTIDELHEMPEERLAAIKSIGRNTAKRIKLSVAEHDARVSSKTLEEAALARERKAEKITLALQAKIGELHGMLEGLNERLKPLGKKKYLALYIDFKKKAARLRARLDDMEPSLRAQPKKVKKNILRRANALCVLLDKAGQKRKKKRYREVTREMQSFSRMLQDIRPNRESPSVGNEREE